MIHRIEIALKAHDLLIESQGLASLENWCGCVQTDNRLITAGDVFVCIKGEHFDGHEFISHAIQAGAALIISQEEHKLTHPYILVTDTRKAAAIIAKTIMLPAELPYKIIGVTGTNGKTTSSLILYDALMNMGYKCGWIGTLGFYINGKNYATNHTTPDIIQLNQIFKQMVENAVNYVIMEVSSHALSLDRVYGVEFDYCLFSNLSREHLDFHGDMDSYFEAKYLLFERGMKRGATAIVNTADQYGAEICRRLLEKQVACLSMGNDNADYLIRDVNTDISGSSFTLVHDDSPIHITSKLIGSFNIQNLGLTAVTLQAMGFTEKAIETALSKVLPVKGRIQRVENSHDIGVFIDYAHTPDAIENLLKSVEELPHKRIICLFGAGGDRDKGKRPLMLKAALKHSDAVFVTDDNPRFEAPDSIIRDIVVACEPKLPWWIIRDRKTAIKASIKLAQPGDIVVICGKGHESYQEIEGVRHHFDDYEEAQQALGDWKSRIEKSDDELVLPVDITMIELLYQIEKPDNTDGYKPPKHFSYISTDSRQIKDGSLFFAIVGERYDGHSYVPEVLANAKNFVLCEEAPSSTISSANYYTVENSIYSLGLLCQKYLQMFAPQKIAITGSTGKTTSKELIAQVLNDHLPCLKTMHNENNLIGLCKTILRVTPAHKFAVFELGTNHFGEIAKLADIVCPDIAIILNIGPSHLEYLKDEDGVYLEKSALFKRPLALRLYPGDDHRFYGFKSEGVSIGYGEVCDYQVSKVTLSSGSQSFVLAGLTWQIPYPAPHYAINAAFAIVLALKLGLTQEEIQKSLQKPINIDMRLQLFPRGKGTLIVDCYNANPCSMQKALEFWQQVQPGYPHIAILGDMLELGENTAMYHLMIGAMLTEMKVSELYTVGEYAKHYHDSSDLAPMNYATVEELKATEKLTTLAEDAVILIKASHGIHLERLLSIFQGGL